MNLKSWRHWIFLIVSTGLAFLFGYSINRAFIDASALWLIGVIPFSIWFLAWKERRLC